MGHSSPFVKEFFIRHVHPFFNLRLLALEAAQQPSTTPAVTPQPEPVQEEEVFQNSEGGHSWQTAYWLVYVEGSISSELEKLDIN